MSVVVKGHECATDSARTWWLRPCEPKGTVWVCDDCGMRWVSEGTSFHHWKRLKSRFLSLKTEGENNRGAPVRVVRCWCGWVHMSAYKRFKWESKRQTDTYLLRRFNAHICCLPKEDDDD